MHKHDYYADLTVFDRAHAQLGLWFSGHLADVRVYAWSAGFAVLGLASFLVACGLLAWGLQVRWFSDLPVGLHDALARTLTVLLALFASIQLFKQSVCALPQDFSLPAYLFSGRHRIELLVVSGVSAVAPFALLSSVLLGMGDLVMLLLPLSLLSGSMVWYRHRANSCASQQPAVPAKTAARKAEVAAVSAAGDGGKIQDFLAAVRAAGVNVSIARALFTAGIRSEKQLRSLDDEALLRIHGVGPASVRKLRTCFSPGQQQAG